MTYPTQTIPGINPQNINIATPIGLQTAARDPTAQDNTFVPGSEWQNSVTKLFWKCQSSTIAGAVWIPFAGASTGTVVSLTANSGGAVGPDGMGNINVVGDGTTINIVGNPGTNTLTASLVGGGGAAESFITNVSGPVVPNVSGQVNVNASTSTYTNGSVANTLKTEVQGTNHAVFIGKGTHTPASTIAVGSNGQVLIGATAADPAFGTLTSADGSITFTTGANTLDLVVSGGTGFGKTITGNDSVALSPTAGNWNIVGTQGVTTTGSGSTLTIHVAGEGLTWNLTNANIANLAVESGYFCVSPGGALTLGLPATSVLGDTIKVVLDGAVSWQITQAAGQQIRVAKSTTTLGAGGSITSTAQGDSITLVCRVANTIWTAVDFVGNLTVI